MFATSFDWKLLTFKPILLQKSNRLLRLVSVHTKIIKKVLKSIRNYSIFLADWKSSCLLFILHDAFVKDSANRWYINNYYTKKNTVICILMSYNTETMCNIYWLWRSLNLGPLSSEEERGSTSYNLQYKCFGRTSV